uniref:Cx9C motif-containing protein 4-like n=1 Tax=Nicotiana sylvestris TaxID=4096 RepID=A0A1U7YCT2_NICSY|nr:PREDICTED: cx9C motif-containing protein 4-like [Nicotiana sylvestris]
MTQPSKEPCKKQACGIQACLSKNNFLSQSSVRCNSMEAQYNLSQECHTNFPLFRSAITCCRN